MMKCEHCGGWLVEEIVLTKGGHVPNVVREKRCVLCSRRIWPPEIEQQREWAREQLSKQGEKRRPGPVPTSIIRMG